MLWEHSGRSVYNGLQIEATRRFKDGNSFGFAYTYSKTMDGNSGPRQGFYDVFNQALNWGKSDNDTRHIAVINFVYELPLLRGNTQLLGKLLGGWQLSGVTQFQTGTPITIGTTDDFYGIGSPNAKPWNLNGTTTQPKQFSEPDAPGSYRNDTNFWFMPTVNGQPWATKPANGTYGNQNRGSIPFNNVGFQNWNLALFKMFRVSERQGVQFRFDAFNWINHPNWGGADTGPTSANFGKVTSKSSERNLQLSLRYLF